MANSDRITALRERITALQRQARARRAPFGAGHARVVDDALAALSLLAGALLDSPGQDDLTRLEDTVESISERLNAIGRLG